MKPNRIRNEPNPSQFEDSEKGGLDAPHHIRPSHPQLPIPTLSNGSGIDVHSSFGVDEPSFDVGDETTDGSRAGASVGELEDVRYRGGFGETEAVKRVIEEVRKEEGRKAVSDGRREERKGKRRRRGKTGNEPLEKNEILSGEAFFYCSSERIPERSVFDQSRRGCVSRWDVGI